jgi:hypothetical protein
MHSRRKGTALHAGCVMLALSTVISIPAPLGDKHEYWQKGFIADNLERHSAASSVLIALKVTHC